MDTKSIYAHPWVESFRLTPREVDVLACLLENQATKKIAPILSIGIKGMDTHILNIMRKLNQSARANVIDFGKKSGCAKALHAHYLDLFAAFEFQKTLQTIRQHIKTQNVVCKIACKDEELKEHIESDLQSLNIACFERKKEATIILIEPRESYYQTFFDVLSQLLPYPFVENAINQFKANISASSDVGHASKNASQWQTGSYIRSFVLNIILGLILLGTVGYGVFSWYEQTKNIPIRSDFPIPINDYYLKRPKLIAQITEKLKGVQGIQTVVLLGMGGMGKTTLAREYASIQDVPVAWEINAENNSKILLSFESLASALAKTETDQQAIDRIKKIEGEQEYRNQLIQFVRQKLHQKNRWFMIFDNVDDFERIQPFLPIDSKAWGRGQIIITTRNTHLKNNSFISPDHIIPVSVLDSCEQIKLFAKIMYSAKQLTENDYKNLEWFLKQLPPFPLDISIAAHYIKNTGLSFSDYLNHLNLLSGDFDNSQLLLEKQINDYGKTRYGIVSGSLQYILKYNQNFLKLLLLISTIGSQDIPKKLLCYLAKEQEVEKFIFEMSRSGLLTYSTKNNRLSLHRSIQSNIYSYLHQILSKENLGKYFVQATETLEQYYWPKIEQYDTGSIRSFRPHLFEFLNKAEIYSSFSKKITHFLLGASYTVLGDSATAMRFISKSTDYTSCFPNDITDVRMLTYAGIAEKEFANYPKAQFLLERSVYLYKKDLRTDALGLALALRHLCYVYRSLADFKKAEDAINLSIQIYKKHNKNCLEMGLAYSDLATCYQHGAGDYKKAIFYRKKSLLILQNLCGADNIKTAFVHRLLGLDYEKSGFYLEALQNLKMSYGTYNKYYQDSYHHFAWSMSSLGYMYSILGVNKEAECLLNKAYKIFLKRFGEGHSHTNWVLVLLGKFHLRAGQYKVAKKIFEQTLAGHIKQFGENHYRISWILHSLGLTYGQLGMYPEADKCFEQSLRCYEKKYGKQHIEYALVLEDFGQYLMLRKNLDTAESMLNQSLSILERENHPERYKCYEHLGDLYTRKEQKKKAEGYYITALKIAKKNFPKNSAHIARLKSKIPFIKRCALFLNFFRI